MELEDFLNKVGIVIAQLIIVLHVIQYGPRLRFHLINVHVINSSYCVRFLLPLGFLLALLILRLSVILFGQSHLRCRAVIEMAALLLPEVFQVFALQL